MWEIITKGMAAYLAQTNPEAALWLQSTQPQSDQPSEGAVEESSNIGTSDDSQVLDNHGRQATAENFPGSANPASEDLDQIKAWAELALSMVQ